MSEHTPGRIQLAKEFDGHIMTTDGLAVADCCLDYSSLDHDQQVSNARRLVACWNACEGVSTEALERLGTLDRARVELDVIRSQAVAQRDELLAALQGVAAIAHSGGLVEMPESDALIAIRRATLTYWDSSASDNQTRAAIAKVKGGAA